MSDKGLPYIDHSKKKTGPTMKGPNQKSTSGGSNSRYKSPKGESFNATVGNPHNHDKGGY